MRSVVLCSLGIVGMCLHQGPLVADAPKEPASKAVNQSQIQAPRGRQCFNTDFGLITLVFNAPEVTGSYSYGGGGMVNGRLEGHTLTGTWREPGATKYPKSGEFEFVFGEDWNAFTGWYRYEGESNWKDKWNGTHGDCK